MCKQSEGVQGVRLPAQKVVRERICEVGGS